MPFISFSCLITIPPVRYWIKDEQEHPCLVPCFKGNVYFILNVSYRFLIGTFHHTEEFLFYSSFLRGFFFFSAVKRHWLFMVLDILLYVCLLSCFPRGALFLFYALLYACTRNLVRYLVFRMYSKNTCYMNELLNLNCLIGEHRTGEKTCILLLEQHYHSSLSPPNGSISELQEKLLGRWINI